MAKGKLNIWGIMSFQKLVDAFSKRGVNPENGNNIISESVETWKTMGLTNDQIALGVALMYVESKYDPNAKNPNSTAYGLGQFLDGTWSDAVDIYNSNNDPDLEYITSRTDSQAQIEVLGSWIKDELWVKAEQMINDQFLSSYSFDDIVYALHHEGQNSSAERLKKYLDGDYKTYSFNGFINDISQVSKNILNAEDSIWFTIPDSLSRYFTRATQWVASREPLTLDLDGDGIETVAINTNNPILFDHDADGVKTATGWVGPDDGLLVLDRNNNGAIDNGRELFGDSTQLSSGGNAADGFAALADLDSNADGVIDGADAQFNNLRVWRDLNQDGISQANELSTLEQQNIASISLTTTQNNQLLPDGNRIAASFQLSIK